MHFQQMLLKRKSSESPIRWVAVVQDKEQMEEQEAQEEEGMLGGGVAENDDEGVSSGGVIPPAPRVAKNPEPVEELLPVQEDDQVVEHRIRGLAFKLKRNASSKLRINKLMNMTGRKDGDDLIG